jgi:hypothetical protein
MKQTCLNVPTSGTEVNDSSPSGNHSVTAHGVEQNTNKSIDFIFSVVPSKRRGTRNIQENLVGNNETFHVEHRKGDRRKTLR